MYPVCAKCPAYLILLNLITLIVFLDEYNLCSFSVYNVLQLLIISSFAKQLYPVLSFSPAIWAEGLSETTKNITQDIRIRNIHNRITILHYRVTIGSVFLRFSN